MSFLHGSDFSRLFLHTTNICVQRQDTLIGAFCATKSASQYWRTKCWLPIPLDMLPWLSCLNSVFSQSSTHSSSSFPMYWDTDSLVVKVSKLVHFQPDFWTFARAVLNSLSFLTWTCCAFNDESHCTPRCRTSFNKAHHEASSSSSSALFDTTSTGSF